MYKIRILYYFITGYYQECKSCGTPIIAPIKFNTSFKFHCGRCDYDLEYGIDTVKCPEI